MVTFEQRSYGGKIFRPTPKVEFSPDHGYLFICTPWGAPGASDRLISATRDLYLSSREDEESTSPFDRLSCISSIANDLRISLKVGNDVIYSEENREEYVCGFEVLGLVYDGTEVTWAQVGMPSLFLDRPNSPLIPLGSTHDLSTEFSLSDHSLPPLPAKMLGTDPMSDFEMHSLRIQKGESLVFLSRSFIPTAFFDLPYGNRSVKDISGICANDNDNLPFWVATLQF